ncbi:MAG: hypothetical protein ABH834_03425 [Candidatus Altiarchaeota archaeon]
MMANWRDCVLIKIGSEEHGTTKQSIQAYVKKNAKANTKHVSDFIDSLIEWGILDTYKVTGQKRYRIRTPQKKKPSGKETPVIFGNKVPLRKIKDAAHDAYRIKKYTTDDIDTKDFIPCEEGNLMIKIALLDHIEEQVKLHYPQAKIERKNKLTLEIN